MRTLSEYVKECGSSIISQNILITGMGGSGKTVLAQLLLEYLSNQDLGSKIDKFVVCCEQSPKYREYEQRENVQSCYKVDSIKTAINNLYELVVKRKAESDTNNTKTILIIDDCEWLLDINVCKEDMSSRLQLLLREGATYGITTIVTTRNLKNLELDQETIINFGFIFKLRDMSIETKFLPKFGETIAYDLDRGYIERLRVGSI